MSKELCEDMLEALENCCLTMRTAGLSFATETIAAQIQGFREMIQEPDGKGESDIVCSRESQDGD